ncbi:MAG TPA: hypothetical protein VFC51_07980 [Chloroflexota bacterium]|nr:hypothetical protein [Chloroflexota bacterium]
MTIYTATFADGQVAGQALDGHPNLKWITIPPLPASNLQAVDGYAYASVRDAGAVVPIPHTCDNMRISVSLNIIDPSGPYAIDIVWWTSWIQIGSGGVIRDGYDLGIYDSGMGQWADGDTVTVGLWHNTATEEYGYHVYRNGTLFHTRVDNAAPPWGPVGFRFLE